MKERKIRLGLVWLFFILSTVFLVTQASAEMVARLPQVMRPNYIACTDQRVYVVEQSSKVHIYGRGPKGMAFEKTFGQAGEGPAEFGWIHQIRPLKEHLEIPTEGKFARFSLDGQFLDEIKLPMRVFKNAIYHIGENYLARDCQFDNKETTTTINLYDKDLKLIREIGVHKAAGGVSKINLAAEYYSARVVGEQIYLVESGKVTIVRIYDQNGAQKRAVRLPLPPMKMTDALKETIIKPMKEDPQKKSRWAAFEARLAFPDHTPGLDYFMVVDGKFVVRTYKYRNDAVEFAIFDLQGKELQRVFLPNTGRLNIGCLFCFFQGRFYYLKENLDEEVWELHSEKVW